MTSTDELSRRLARYGDQLDRAAAVEAVATPASRPRRDRVRPDRHHPRPRPWSPAVRLAMKPGPHAERAGPGQDHRRPLLLPAALVVAVVAAIAVAVAFVPSGAGEEVRVGGGEPTMMAAADLSPGPRGGPLAPADASPGTSLPAALPAPAGDVTTTTTGAPGPSASSSPAPAPDVAGTLTEGSSGPATPDPVTPVPGAPTVSDGPPTSSGQTSSSPASTTVPPPSTTLPTPTTAPPLGRLVMVTDTAPNGARQVAVAQRPPTGDEWASPVEAAVRTEDPTVILLQISVGNGCLRPMAYQLEEVGDHVRVSAYINYSESYRALLPEAPLCTQAFETVLVTAQLSAPLADRLVYDTAA